MHIYDALIFARASDSPFRRAGIGKNVRIVTDFKRDSVYRLRPAYPS